MLNVETTHPVLEQARRAAGAAADMLTPDAWDSLWQHCLARREHLLGIARTCGNASVWAGAETVLSRDGTNAALSKLAASLDAQWLDQAQELTRRLAADRHLIMVELAAGADPGRVEFVRAGLGDPHHGGRTATAIIFASGLRIVYKPRSVALLAAWRRLLRRLEGAAGLSGFVVPRVLDRGGYGWVAWIDERRPSDSAEAHIFGRRAGFMLAITEVLGSSDLHRENVLVCGGSPVIIDGETLLRSPWPRRPSVDTVRGAAFAALMDDGVVRTGLLPRWQLVRGCAADASPLSADVDGVFGGLVRDGILRGLVQGYQVMMSDVGRRTMALFFEEVRGRPVRVVRLSTALYDAARSEYLRALLLESAPRPAASQGPSALSLLTDAEREDIQRLDIPRIERDALLPCADRIGGQGRERRTSEEASAGSPVGYARARLHKLDVRHLARQLLLTRASIGLRVMSRGQMRGSGRPRPVDEEPISEAPTVDSDQNIAAAERLGDAILSGAIRSGGAMFWLTCRPVGGARTWRLEPADFGLYDGGTGTALFFAALARCTGSSRWESAATEAMRPVLAALAYRGGGPDLATRFGVGGAEGLGGVLYGLALFRSMMGEPFPFTAAFDALSRIDHRAGASPELLYGHAGLVLGALALYESTADAAILERMARVGLTLLEPAPDASSAIAAIRSTPGCKTTGWRSAPGVAHGALGVALALARLWHHTHDLPFLSAARAMQQRAQLADPSPSNGDASWCSGHSGRAVCLQALHAAGEATGVADAAAADALIDVLSGCRTDRDATLCCGAAGRLDVLVTASPRLESPERPSRQGGGGASPTARAAVLHREVARLAHVLAEQVFAGQVSGRIGRSGWTERRGRAEWPQRMPRSEQQDGQVLVEPAESGRGPRELWGVSAGLYGGVSGVGYALLRAAFPQLVPSPLRWQLEDLHGRTG